MVEQIKLSVCIRGFQGPSSGDKNVRGPRDGTGGGQRIQGQGEGASRASTPPFPLVWGHLWAQLHSPWPFPGLLKIPAVSLSFGLLISSLIKALRKSLRTPAADQWPLPKSFLETMGAGGREGRVGAAFWVMLGTCCGYLAASFAV